MIRALRHLVLTWGALVLPLFVSAHNGEVLLSRLTLHADGSCSLKVTADLEANYNIRERAELAKAAEGLFRVSTGKDEFPLTEAAGSPDFSSATKLDLDSPFQHTAEELAKSYQLESAEWSWTPEPRNFLLRLPDESPHTVLLWLVDETKPGVKARWVMMVAGDESPLIQAHEPTGHPGRRMLLICGGLMLAVAAALVGGFLLLRRRRAKSAA
ncbi:MAG: hypothetical protein EBR95_02280 [Verrucomicrobia bacterium]|nr:hypothetical protein [Verrucomicrobiota bacterium]